MRNKSTLPARQSVIAGTSSSGEAMDLEIQLPIHQIESEYQTWWTWSRFVVWYEGLPDDTTWNCYICLIALMAILWAAVDFTSSYVNLLDIVYNLSYGVHIFSIGCNLLSDNNPSDLSPLTVLGFLIDLGTYSHYVSSDSYFPLVCYYMRLHRPLRYLWELNDYNMKGSVLGTTLKYCYICVLLRITLALVWLHVAEVDYGTIVDSRRIFSDLRREDNVDSRLLKGDAEASEFLSALYIVNKMFIPIGSSVIPATDMARVVCLIVMVTGCLVVTGVAVASLALVISQYMRPEEAFRARYKLIIKEMKESHIPAAQRDKVEAFYNMYWHKQKAVSSTHLLPTFPPTLPVTIYTDIYFEATQKTRILRYLSSQFLCELAQKMKTIHYIPGDAIVKRSSLKSTIIYLTYGDVELLTAEDDITAILRMTRGTVLTPCAVCPANGCSSSHLEIRAATFCTAHVLRLTDLWRVALKHGRSSYQGANILEAFNKHMGMVKRHYTEKAPEIVKHKSSILLFKRSLLALREATDANGNLILARTDWFLEVAGCYVMRNRSDASLTDEADGICLRTTFPCILQPYSSLQDVWHSFVACLIIIVCFTHPFYMVYMKTVPIEFRFFDYVVTAVYVLDLIVHLSTGSHVEEGVPITFSQTSSQQMRSKWFALDVIGTVPVLEFVGGGHFAGMNKLLRLPKVFRVLKSLEETCVHRSNVLRFLTYTLLLIVACYLVAALQQAFMCFQFGYCQVSNFTHSPFWEFQPMDDERVESRLIFGLYWAISMITFTTHKSTWGPENWNNVLYIMFVLEICFIVRMFMEAVYSATIMVTTALREDYDAFIGNVKKILIRNKFDPVLRQRLMTYLQLCWHTDKAYSMTNKKSSIFYDLPPHANQDILAIESTSYILSIPFMKLLQKDELKVISSKARLFYTSPNEILLNTGDVTNEMYVIKKGYCEILSPDTKKVVGTIGPRNHFGVFACLLRIPVFYTVRATTHVQLFSISRKHLLQALENPKLKKAIKFTKNQPEYKRRYDYREPFISYMPPQPPPNMERFRLPRKHEPDTEFLQPFNRLGFLSVLRYIFPRFTIRPDSQYLTSYEWFRATCAMASAMVFPSYAYLVLQWPGLYLITIVLDLSAYFDIFQRMLVGYYNEQGILVYHPFSTAVHYLKGSFIIDLLGCLALENLDAPRREPFGDLQMYQVTKTEQFLMMNRLLQLYRVPGVILVLSTYIQRRDIILVFVLHLLYTLFISYHNFIIFNIIKAIPLFLALLNVFTCLMVFYSVNIYYSPDTYKWLIVPHNDSGGSWIHLFEKTFRFNLTDNPWNLHLTCYFWVVYETTSTGYNCFNPSNYNLMEILFIGMVIASMIITYFAVRVISIRANVNKPLASFQEHIKDILVFMRREDIDKGLQNEVFGYFEYNWEKMGGIDYRGMLKLCDQITLRTDAMLHLFGPTFSTCPILSNCDVSLLRIIGRAVNSVYFLSGMKIVDTNDVIQDMYFLDYGGIDVRHTTGDLCTVVKLPKGSIFGNIEGADTIRCPVTFIATSPTHLLVINSKVFHEIIKEFPEAQALMKQHLRNAIQNYIRGNVEDTVKSKKNSSLNYSHFILGRKGIIQQLYFNKSTFIQIYLIVVSLLCIYIDLYNAGFQDNSIAIVLILYVLDIAFFVKILIQYLLPQMVDKLHFRRKLIPLRTKYFKRDFKYDALSCLPIELFSVFSSKNHWIYFSVLRLNRVLRIVTVYKCLERRHERVTINLTLNTVFSVLIWFTLFVHTATCLWYSIGVIEESSRPGSSWLYTDSGQSWCNNLYICSFYFVLTTFTHNGVGDIMPRKQSEVVFVSILQIISTMVYMVYVGEFSNIIQYQSFRSFSFYSNYLELQEFLKNNRVSKNLVKLVNAYSLHLWRDSRGMQEPHFLKTAPHCLRLIVMSAVYLHHLTGHPVFKNCEPAFLRQLVGCLHLYTYNKDMYVVKENEITESMYLIHTGRVQEATETVESPPRIYSAGSCFGILQGLTGDTPYTNSYRTMGKCQVLTLHLKDWAYLLKHFPESRDVIYKNTNSNDFGKNGAPSKDSYGSDTKKPPKDSFPSNHIEEKGSRQDSPLNSDFEVKSSQLVLSSEPKVNSLVLKVSKETTSAYSKYISENVHENSKNKTPSFDQPQVHVTHEAQPSRVITESEYLDDNIAASSSKLLNYSSSDVRRGLGREKYMNVQYTASNQSINNIVPLLNDVNLADKAIREVSKSFLIKESKDSIDITESKSNVNDHPQADKTKPDSPSKIMQVQESVTISFNIDKLGVADGDNTLIGSSETEISFVGGHYGKDITARTNTDNSNIIYEKLTDPQTSYDQSIVERNTRQLDNDDEVKNYSEIDPKAVKYTNSKSSTTPDSNFSIKSKYHEPTQ